MDATGIILAGGKSSRMGTNKALLFIDGKKTTIETIIGHLRPFFSTIILVTNDHGTYDFLEMPIVSDQYIGKGPLAGIHSGLKHSTSLYNFFVACDMPFVSGELAQYLVRLCMENDYDAIVPSINGKLHPLFSVFKQTALPVVEKCLLEERLRIRDLLDDLTVRYINETEIKEHIIGDIEKIFYNMNYPLDYESVKRELNM
ncbi:molybdenum cofactor guanylyltransferase [Bacillus sp. Marseille-P3661]|uniref:molybdenum cofactor guanylyltransferase n=1 Tax=Bacillus sp. Marseille-P3661 TaxID=1936234 RepID=UPI000C817745|nr:molybdenum cofactor guanylyltransferase [Bacillus sp. Marseille-P3661]